MRTLIVDDEADMRALVRATIVAANEGLVVAGEARSGEEAIALWREVRPEAIVLDHRMPDLTGLEVAQRILEEQPDQAIILFSAYFTTEIEETADALGICACLPKDEYRAIPATLWRCAPPV